MPTVCVAEPKETFETFVRETLNSSPQRASIEAHYDMDKARHLERALLQDPSLSAQVDRAVTDSRDLKSYQGGVQLSQPLRLSDFGEREEAKAAGEQRAAVERDSALLALSFEIAALYSELWSSRSLDERFTALLKKGESFQQRIGQGEEKGLIGKGQSALFRSQLGILKQSRFAAKSAFLEAKSKLLEYGQQRGEHFTPARPAIAPLPQEDPKNSAPSLLRRRILKRYLKDALLEVARADRVSMITPELRYSYSAEDIHQVGIGFSIALPFWNGNKAARLKHTYQKKAAEAELEAFTPERWREFTELSRTAVTLRKQQLAVLENEVVPELERAFIEFGRIVTRGGGDFLDLWQTLHQLRAQLELARRTRTEALRARLFFALLTGEDLFGVLQ